MQPVRALQSTGKSKACFTWHYAFVKNSFPLTELSLYTTDMLMNMDWDLLGVVNPILDGATGIRLQDGASCDILLPFDLYRYRFTSSEWNGLEQSSIWLQVTNYPTRKIIQVNIGEE